MRKTLVSLFVELAVSAALAAGLARVRIVNIGSAPLELEDGTVVPPGGALLVEVPAGQGGTIFGQSYPALPEGAIFALRAVAADFPPQPESPMPVAKADAAPEPTPAVETVAAPGHAPVADPVSPKHVLPASAPEAEPGAAADPMLAAAPEAIMTAETVQSAMPLAPAGMVFVPAGVNEGVDPETGPYRLVSPGYFMDQSEVTLAQWRLVRDWATAHGYRFGNEGGGKGDNHPVHTVSWYDCVKWCNARSEMNGLKPVYYFKNHVLRDDVVSGLDSPDVDAYGRHDGYRLPSRDQWDFAARGGVSSTLFPWGNVITRDYANVLGDKGAGEWFDNVSLGDPASDPLFEYDTRFRAGGMPFTCPAGTFPPNGYGLTEMQGNLNEWLNDTSFWITAQEGAAYGGSWAHGAGDCRLGILLGKERRWANDTIGFRTVLPAGVELPFSLRDDTDLPEAVHSDAEERRANAISPWQFDEDGWRWRNPPASTFDNVREQRRKWRMSAGAIAIPTGATGQSVVHQDVVPAQESVPAEQVKDLGQKEVITDPDQGFKVRRVPPDEADLLVSFNNGKGTVPPNSNFGYGSILLALANRTQYRIVMCVVRIIRPSGWSSDIFFTDIAPGEEKDADNPEMLVGAFVRSDFMAEPFLFPALIVAEDLNGNVLDLYETPDCPSIGYLNVH